MTGKTRYRGHSWKNLYALCYADNNLLQRNICLIPFAYHAHIQSNADEHEHRLHAASEFYKTDQTRHHSRRGRAHPGRQYVNVSPQ